MLTDLRLQRFKASKGRRVELHDREGLGIRIGKRWTWFFKYTFEGRRQRLSLGTYPDMTLTVARNKASEAKVKVEKGIDPGVLKKEAKQARKAAPTVADFIEEFYDRRLKCTRSGKERKRLLTYDVLPKLGKKKMADVTRRDITGLLDDIEDRAPVVRNRVYSVLHLMFKVAIKRGVIETSPCTDFDKAEEAHRERVLSDEEIKLVWAALNPANKDVDIYAITKLAIKMVLVTGQRPGEVCGMAEDELDLETKFWTIPASRMKGKTAHRVPLTNTALEIITQARAYSGDSPYVFKAPHMDKPLTSNALPKAMRRHWEKEIGIPEAATPHDMRRTVRTRLAEIGVEDIIAERVLAHKLQGIVKVYNHYAYDKEKRQALTQWETKLRLIVGLDKPETARVIPIKG